MKYTILINQAGIVQSGLHTQTDYIDWALLEYISDLRIENKFPSGCFYLMRYDCLIADMPILGFRITERESIKKRIQKLVDLALMSTAHDFSDGIYVRTTDLYLSIAKGIV